MRLGAFAGDIFRSFETFGTRPLSAMTEHLDVKGLVITSPGNVSIQRFSLPKRDEYVQVKVDACGLCTWEQRVYKGVKPTYPFWGGHEVCGTVYHDNAGTLKSGERVALALMRRCGECDYCKKGLNNHCAYVHPEAAEAVPNGPRGLSDMMLVPSYKVFRLGPNVPVEVGALVEPLACVIRSVDKGQLTFGNTAVVIGGGSMGLIHTALLKMLGCHVIVCDDDPRRAVSAGADAVLPPNGCREEIDHLTSGRGADAVFCTAGGVDAIQLAVAVASRGGRIVLYQSIRGSALSSVDMNDVHYREIQIKGTISQTIDDFQRAASLVSTAPNFLNFLTTEMVNAERGKDAFDKAVSHSANRVLVSFA